MPSLCHCQNDACVHRRLRRQCHRHFEAALLNCRTRKNEPHCCARKPDGILACKNVVARRVAIVSARLILHAAEIPVFPLALQARWRQFLAAGLLSSTWALASDSMVATSPHIFLESATPLLTAQNKSRRPREVWSDLRT